ncbi:MAG TPA: flagellar hook-associated protein FlgK [Phenylobacterium sp.]|jgi:flagellar hook-associated protein 1 FlgK|uniref:flagellar hook-associated protein FlgK n=1 Tax=Phenylobacterium sp. TaxID=1871053 RepID=UPI002B90B4C3|nr:flagellar hook-associated protein FlgK [Phenylobacterium sp.]HXA40067.1 flagellar hook-associated protein FlgK [Phenylobacterium sp.]
MAIGSLSSALSAATSGLQAAQAALSAVSDNIANVNTPGYTRKTVVQQEQVVAGAGAGVNVTGVQRVTNQYLQAASLTAGADSSRYSVYSSFLDSAQALFGDPSASDYFFNLPNQISANFASAANDPSSSLLGGQALNSVSNFLSDANRINTQIGALGSTATSQINNDVTQVNSLLTQIDSLNTDIARAKVSGGDSTGSENIQSQLLNQLSALMNVQISARSQGGVTVRSTEGVQLVGDGGASTLGYSATATTPGYITATTPGASSGPQAITVSSGEIRGLLDLKNVKLPGISDQLGEFVSRAAQALNAASNASTASPPPASLTGRNTGLDLPTAVSGFSGQSTVAITNSAGVVQKTVAIDFTAGTMSVNGAPGVAFTPANFLAQLNTALGASGSASFTNGALTLAATGGNGVAIDEGTSQKAGQGFSQFFGMNDLITSTGLSTYDTGLSAGDPNGFAPGSTITLQLSTPDGRPLQQVTVAVPPAGSPTMGDLVNALNNNANGVGLYGAFTLDAQGGLTFTGTPPQNAQISVAQDSTQRGAGGPSMSQLFGLGVGPRSTRADSYQVNPTLSATPTLLPMGKLNLAAPAGQSAIAPGDGSGALALSQATQATTLFKAAGDLGNVSMTLDSYAAQFGGSIGRDAATAASQSASATAVQTQADAKRASVEGVNIDEELIHLTTYQQAYSANARMIQATKDLFTTLMSILP